MQIIEENNLHARKIQQGVQELQHIVESMEFLAETETDLIDSISANIQDTKDYVHSTVEHMENSLHYEWEAMKKQVMIFGCCLIVAAILLGSFWKMLF